MTSHEKEIKDTTTAYLFAKLNSISKLHKAVANVRGKAVIRAGNDGSI